MSEKVEVLPSRKHKYKWDRPHIQVMYYADVLWAK